MAKTNFRKQFSCFWFKSDLRIYQQIANNAEKLFYYFNEEIHVIQPIFYKMHFVKKSTNSSLPNSKIQIQIQNSKFEITYTRTKYCLFYI